MLTVWITHQERLYCRLGDVTVRDYRSMPGFEKDRLPQDEYIQIDYRPLPQPGAALRRRRSGRGGTSGLPAVLNSRGLKSSRDFSRRNDTMKKWILIPASWA